MPYFLGGLRISGGLSLIGAIVAEFVAGTGGRASGLAYRILEAGYQLQIPRMFAALLLISLTGIIIFLCLSLISHLCLRKWHEERDPARELDWEPVPLADPIARGDLNRPAVVAELAAMYDRYERALMADDRPCSTACSGTARRRSAMRSGRTRTAMSRSGRPRRDQPRRRRGAARDPAHHGDDLRCRLRHRECRVFPPVVGAPRPPEPGLGQVRRGRLARRQRACLAVALVSCPKRIALRSVWEKQATITISGPIHRTLEDQAFGSDHA